jgi:hypothetical protein
MATQTPTYVDELKINQLTQAQYNTVAVPSATELYFITDGAISYNDLVDTPILGTMAAENKNNYVVSNTTITAGTKCKISYDSKGLVVGGSDLSASDIPNLSLSKITDVTATATEVNVLHGITANTIELNYVDGVTSNIQTQLNNRVVKNNAISAGTATKITYDSKGLVTSGTSLSAGDIPDLTLAKITDVTATAAEVNKLHGMTATTTELNYVHGVTSDIQTQINNRVIKNNDITGATKTKITYDSKGLVTAGADLVEDDIPSLHLSKVTDVTASATEVNYLSGVTSAVQTQLNNKVDKVTTASKVYGTDSSGNQTTYSISSSASASTVAYRTSGGRLAVGTPTADSHAATKKYVDDGLATKQNTLTAGTGISISSNTISTDRTIVTFVDWATA